MTTVGVVANCRFGGPNVQTNFQEFTPLRLLHAMCHLLARKCIASLAPVKHTLLNQNMVIAETSGRLWLT